MLHKVGKHNKKPLYHYGLLSATFIENKSRLQRRYLTFKPPGVNLKMLICVSCYTVYYILKSWQMQNIIYLWISCILN